MSFTGPSVTGESNSIPTTCLLGAPKEVLTSKIIHEGKIKITLTNKTNKVLKYDRHIMIQM